MKYIDLHVHSTCSDGTYTPEELVDYGIEKELAAIALTDHDTVSGVKRAISRANETDNKIIVVPGIELSCEHTFPGGRKREIHILGYCLDYNNPHLIDTLENIAEERDNRNKKMCDNLQNAGYPIRYEELINEFPETIITRAHFAKLLVKNGAFSTIDSVFKSCLNDKGRYYVHRRYLTPKEGIELIYSCGGIPVLAHPLLYKLNPQEMKSLLNYLKELKIQGIEAMYSRNHGNDEAYVRKLAAEYDLFVTGGSDFHGTNKPDIDLGRGCGRLFVPYTVLDNLGIEA